jgi:hypothetical protein
MSNTLEGGTSPTKPKPEQEVEEHRESPDRPTFSTDYYGYVIRQGRSDHHCDHVRERGACEHFFIEAPDDGRDLISTLDGRFLTSEAMARKALDAHMTRISRGRSTLYR